MSRNVLCIVPDTSRAEGIITSLQAAGFRPGAVSILYPDRSVAREPGADVHRIHGSAASGAGVGGMLGGALGWLIGAGSLAIPGVGPFIAAGPIWAALGGAAIGATAGGLAGGLVGLGLSEVEAKRYERKVSSGDILISTHCSDSRQVDIVNDIFREVGASDISTTPERRVPEPSLPPPATPSIPRF